MVQIAVVGKSNTGKTTFFSSATLIDAEISNRIFTTIEPNKGVTYVRTKCPCKKMNVRCNPKNSKCVDGIRFVPIKIMDTAGLVPDAHKGRGLGNQFLSDIMEADALIHIVDASGGTDMDGNPVEPGTNDPIDDIKFFEREIDYWIFGILNRNWKQIVKKVRLSGKGFDDMIFQQLSGLKISQIDIKTSLKRFNISVESNEKELMEFVKYLRKRCKPIVTVANKIDIPISEKNVKRMENYGFNPIVCCAEAELALRRAEKNRFIKYLPGDSDFEIIHKMGEKQKNALEFIKDKILKKFGSTGVQNAINTAVFKELDMITVYPVADINKLSDTKGNILPDACIIRNGTTLKEFASFIHSNLAETFIGGLDITKKKIGAEYRLKDGDVIEILFKR